MNTKELAALMGRGIRGDVQAAAQAAQELDRMADAEVEAAVNDGTITAEDATAWRDRFNDGPPGFWADAMAALKSRRRATAAVAAAKRKQAAATSGSTATTTAGGAVVQAASEPMFGGLRREPAVLRPTAMVSGLEPKTALAGVPPRAWGAIARMDAASAQAEIAAFQAMAPTEAETWAELNYAPRIYDTYDAASNTWLTGEW